MHGSPSKFLSIAFSFFSPLIQAILKKRSGLNMKFRIDGELTESAVKNVINYLNLHVNRNIFYILPPRSWRRHFYDLRVIRDSTSNTNMSGSILFFHQVSINSVSTHEWQLLYEIVTRIWGLVPNNKVYRTKIATSHKSNFGNLLIKKI